MTLRNFKGLTPKQKKFVVLRAGIYLSEKKYGLFRKMLYQVDGFYVEVYFTAFSKQPLGFSSFENLRRLHPYLQQIDISGLLKEVSMIN